MNYLRPILAACCLLAVGCGTSSGTLIGAGLNTALGLGAAAASRAEGGCYAVCTAGTVCNPGTGMCERALCEGRCGDHEVCEDSPAGPRCVSVAAEYPPQATPEE
jgi:hypothetical protein